MPIIEIAGQSVYYAARGTQGAPVVFVHGSGGSHLVWNGQLAALAERARVYGVDLPGHGRSALPGRDSVREYAEVVCGFLDALALPQAVIVGHSLGGAITLTMGLEHPDRVLGLGLVGTGARLRVLPAFMEGLLSDHANTVHVINETMFAPDADLHLKELSEQASLVVDPQVFHDDLAACDRFNIMERLGEIRAPTLVVCGDQDRMTPPKFSQYLAAQITGAQLVIVPGAGHMVMLERAEEVSAALAGLVGKVDRETGKQGDRGTGGQANG
ncbi:MAG: alpha/beta hydrolase [Anaerolineae bacterium]